jgi:hypothetical protein
MANEFKIKNGVSIAGTTSGTTIVKSNAVASGTITLPAATDTLVGLATTDTLTNKTLTSPTLTGTPTAPTAAQGTNTTQIATTAFAIQAANDAAVALAIALG